MVAMPGWQVETTAVEVVPTAVAMVAKPVAAEGMQAQARGLERWEVQEGEVVK